MLPLKTIARRIRIKIHDMDAITYTDEEILDAINCYHGNTRIRHRLSVRISPAG